MSDETSTAGGETPANGTPVTGTPATPGETPATSNNLRFKSLEEAHKEYERLEAKFREESKTSAERRVKLKQIEDAQLSESEKRDRDFGDLQKTHSQLQKRYQRLLVKQSILDAAPDMGIKGKLAAALLDWSSLQIDNEGNITNLKDALNALLEEYPDIAVAQQPSSQQPQTQQRQQVPPSNPQRSTTSGYQGVNPRKISWGDAFKQQ